MYTNIIGQPVRQRHFEKLDGVENNNNTEMDFKKQFGRMYSELIWPLRVLSMVTNFGFHKCQEIF
jgi:hypothetical protein